MPQFERYLGMDHAVSFPLRYFEVHRLPPDWPAFLDDFQRHWPTDDDHLLSISSGTARLAMAARAPVIPGVGG